jgi:hypothetical protein
MLNLREYMDWYINREKVVEKNYFNNLFSDQEDRLRLNYIEANNSCVEVDIWITYNYKKKIIVGKNERVYQVVKNLMGIESFTFDHTLFIGEASPRLLDDD